MSRHDALELLRFLLVRLEQFARFHRSKAEAIDPEFHLAVAEECEAIIRRSHASMDAGEPINKALKTISDLITWQS